MDEVQNNFKIMDHQIEHDADIGTAVRIRGEPMRLDETRIRQTFFKGAENGIKTFHVTNLKDEPAFSRQLRQFASMRGVFRDWFLDQKMFAQSEQSAPNFAVSVRRSRNRSCIHFSSKLFQRRRGTDAKLHRQLICFGLIGVINGSKVCSRKFCIKTGVVFSNVPDTNHAHAKLFHRNRTSSAAFCKNHW